MYTERCDAIDSLDLKPCLELPFRDGSYSLPILLR